VAGEVTNERLMQEIERLTRRVGELKTIVLRQGKDIVRMKSGNPSEPGLGSMRITERPIKRGPPK